MSEAITKCQDRGFKDEDIIIDVVMCFKKVVEWDEWSHTDLKYKNAYDLYKRKEYFIDFYSYYE